MLDADAFLRSGLLKPQSPITAFHPKFNLDVKFRRSSPQTPRLNHAAAFSAIISVGDWCCRW
jgi:hypothetical protein